MAQDPVATDPSLEPGERLITRLALAVESLQQEVTALKRRPQTALHISTLQDRFTEAARLDHRYRDMHVRSFVSERDQKAYETSVGWPHMRPDSVLVAPIGNHWAPGAWNRIADMVRHCHQQGIYAGLSELRDRCFEPYDGVGLMRNEAIFKAQNEGFEWLLYVDNDVQPEPDVLIKLLSRQMPIVSPYIVEPGTGKPLFGPTLEPNTGLHPAKWCVLSMLLFRTTVFNCVGPFWRDGMGASEEWHFQYLWHYGHRPYIDTNCHVIVSDKPHYPLSSNLLESGDRQRLWALIQAKRREPPDRRPINLSGEHVVNGEYDPWSIPQEK